MHFTAIVAMFVAVVATAAGQKQTITLYDGFNMTGKSLVVNTSVPDLTRPGFLFSNKAKSVCGSGIWILYKYIKYVTIANRPETNGELVILKDGECWNLKTAPGKVSSVRHAGFLQDVNKPSFNLYQTTGFGFSHAIITDISEKVDRKYGSLIVTGSAQWTIGYDYTYRVPFEYKDKTDRNHICLVPAVEDYVQILATSDMSKGPYNMKMDYIKSVKLGCDGTEDTLIVVGQNRTVSVVGGKKR